MKKDFQEIPPWIQMRIKNIQAFLNQRITKAAPGKREVRFSDNGGKTVNRTASFKLVESEGKKFYIFDDLAR